jgi:hypothetical protein
MTQKNIVESTYFLPAHNTFLRKNPQTSTDFNAAKQWGEASASRRVERRASTDFGAAKQRAPKDSHRAGVKRETPSVSES